MIVWDLFWGYIGWSLIVKDRDREYYDCGDKFDNIISSYANK